jgi:HD-like signal output (HDOD) protein
MIRIESLRMPAVSRECLRVLQLLEAEEVDDRLLVDTVSLDPVLSSTLVRYANSPAHQRGHQVASVRAAITVLGLRQVRAAAVIASMRGCRDRASKLEAQLWEQSAAVATLCRDIALRCVRALADEAELIGLLHNLGAVVLQDNFNDVYAQVCESARQDDLPILLAEREFFGLDRNDLLPSLCQHFRLPPRVGEVLDDFRRGQPPEECETDQQRLLAVLLLAHHGARCSPAAAAWLPETGIADTATLAERLGLGADDLRDLFDDGIEDLQARLCPTDANGHASFHFAAP